MKKTGITIPFLKYLTLLKNEDNISSEIQKKYTRIFSYAGFTSFKNKLIKLGLCEVKEKRGRKKPFDLTEKGIELKNIAGQLFKWCRENEE